MRWPLDDRALPAVGVDGATYPPSSPFCLYARGHGKEANIFSSFIAFSHRFIRFIVKCKITMENKPPTEKIVKSSLIQAYSYDSEAQTLDVTFTDGTQFQYEKVDPPTMSKVFDSPGSVGSKFHKLIARRFKFQKQ